MKTAKNLFSRIVSFENLLAAAHQAARGKRERHDVLAFFRKLEDHLFALQHDLIYECYVPGGYRTFTIYQPKQRLISAAPFRDRVLHHALINVVGPILERGLVYDTYANRVGKGCHRAIRRCQYHLRRYDWCLKCDIKKYFPSIDHLLLKKAIRRKISDAATLRLIDRLIDGSNEQEFVCDYFSGDTLFTPLQRRKGLPIGNLTSQIFANYFLSGLDHFIKEQLQCRGYVRYMDDFLLFGDDKAELRAVLPRIKDYLATLRLKLHAKRTQLFPCACGVSFLGQMIFREFRRLRGANVRSFRKRLRRWGETAPINLQQKIAGWLGHAQQADTRGLLTKFDFLDDVKTALFA